MPCDVSFSVVLSIAQSLLQSAAARSVRGKDHGSGGADSDGAHAQCGVHSHLTREA